MRDKWDEKRFSAAPHLYGERTIRKAIDGCREFYSPPGSESEEFTERARRRQERRAAASEAAQNAPAEDGRTALPVIETNNRHLRDVSGDALAALIAGNDPPAAFVRSGRLVRVDTDEQGRPGIVEMTAPRLRGRLARCANFVSTSEKRGTVPVAPGNTLVEDLLALPGLPGLPPLAASSRRPYSPRTGHSSRRRGICRRRASSTMRTGAPGICRTPRRRRRTSPPRKRCCSTRCSPTSPSLTRRRAPTRSPCSFCPSYAPASTARRPSI
jgi:hypothetical protein